MMEGMTSSQPDSHGMEVMDTSVTPSLVSQPGGDDTYGTPIHHSEDIGQTMSFDDNVIKESAQSDVSADLDGADDYPIVTTSAQPDDDDGDDDDEESEDVEGDDLHQAVIEEPIHSQTAVNHFASPGLDSTRYRTDSADRKRGDNDSDEQVVVVQQAVVEETIQSEEIQSVAARPSLDVTGHGEHIGLWRNNNPQYGRHLSTPDSGSLSPAGVPYSPSVRPKIQKGPKVPKVHSHDDLLSMAVGGDSTDRAMRMSQPSVDRVRNPFRKQSTIPAVSNISTPTEPPDEQFGARSRGAQPFPDEELLEVLKKGNPFKDRKDHRQAQPQWLFLKLRALYQLQREDDQKSYRIEEVRDHISYKRMANVYLLGMQNIFFVPVWAASRDSVSEKGYVMYPSRKKLMNLKAAIEDIQAMSMNTKDERNKVQEKMRELLRMVLAPVALGLDALHWAVPSKRPRFYHRDMCIENIFLPYDTFPVTDNKTNMRQYENAYAEAKILLTRNTRCSNDPEAVENYGSIQAQRLVEQYFHHPAPYRGSEGDLYYNSYRYMKKHDWFSYGVLILELVSEMILMLVDMDQRKSFTLNKFITGDEKVPYYLEFAERLLSKISLLPIETVSTVTKRPFLFYLGIAKECLSTEELSDDFVMEHPIVNEDKDEETYYFEYGVSKQTAKLLGFFDNSKGPMYKNLHDRIQKREDNPDVKPKCISCMLRDSAQIPTRAYRRGAPRRGKGADPRESNYQCNDTICNKFYCHPCYTNHERFFCPIGKHGTTSSRIGHDSCYALIFCGDHFREKSSHNREVFVRDAQHVYNTITHNMVCQVPEDNVILCRLHDGENGDSPQERFENAVKEMRKLIHFRLRLGSETIQTEECSNDRDYCLLVFYSGHGHDDGDDCEDPDGTWAPTEDRDESLEHEYIQGKIDELSQCEKKECQDSAGLVTCVMDHCYTDQIRLAKKGKGKNVTQKVMVSTEPDNKSYIQGEGFAWYSEITDWFCRFLRSIYKCELLPGKCKDKVDGTHDRPCGACITISEQIEDNCGGVYLDGNCLKAHVPHLSRYGGKSKVKLDVTSGKSEVILAHYNPEGVYFNIFPMVDAYGKVSIDFTSEISRGIILEVVRQHLGTTVSDPHIVLLTNHGTDDSQGFSLVWDCEIRTILDASSRTFDKESVSPKILFYHVVKETVKVRLETSDENGLPVKDELELALNESDMFKLINEHRHPSPLSSVPRSQLPNILVHIVHKLFHTHYKHKLSRSTSYNSQSSILSTGGNRDASQPSDSSSNPQTQTLTDQEKVWNSFAGMLYDTPRPEVNISEWSRLDEWRILEENACRYGHPGRARPFEFRDSNVMDSCYLIKWERPVR